MKTDHGVIDFNECKKKKEATKELLTIKMCERDLNEMLQQDLQQDIEKRFEDKRHAQERKARYDQWWLKHWIKFAIGVFIANLGALFFAANYSPKSAKFWWGWSCCFVIQLAFTILFCSRRIWIAKHVKKIRDFLEIYK